ncbi:dermonecrotic toxin domain-containing protein [Pseudomonas sp. DWP1b1]|uniref:dermonecrotic toxin domain-containing protein n=1 Tax=unclassified Pseudomonas TaxID=196821 RepID=UPI003CF41CBD
MAKTPYSLYPLTPLWRAARDIQELFAARTSLTVIAARDLRHTLLATYPTLAVTDTVPVLLAPRYRYQNQTISGAGHERSTLVDALINRFVDGLWVDYTQGQLLTEQPDSTPIIASPLKNLDAQDAVNLRGPLLLERCQQALIDDWTELSIEARSRFEGLSLRLQETLRDLSVPTLVSDPVQRRMINDVLQVPDNNLRGGTTRAYLVDQWGEFGGRSLELLRGMVLIGPASSGETLLLFTLSAGIEVFASRAELGAALRRRLGGLAPGRAMQWRLYEPRSNIFDGFALSFLAKQLSDLQWGVELGRDSPYWNAVLFDTVQWVATGDFDSLRLDADPGLRKLYVALPTWIKQARREVRGLFSQHLRALGVLFNQPNWRFFDDGVPSLLDFARQRLMAAYPKPSTLEPSDVIITVHTVRGVSAAGGFPVKLITTLLNVSLENLASLPGDAIEVALRNGTPPPRWLTPSTIKRLVSEVDIGARYPERVTAALKDSPTEVLWRSRSFIAQLRQELPMLALENYARGRWGFSRKGYDTVAAVMQAQAAERYLGNQVIVLRPLAFKLSTQAKADVVTNMFFIGPRTLDAGPVVLFRPMARPKLMEFADRQDLLKAIKQPGDLQQQVLAWMSDDARAVYRDNGFVVPHFNTVDGLALLIDALSSTPATLATDEVRGDYGQHLYRSQVQAILEQADRQSVSNRENLWARRMEGLSLGLNSVMQLVTGPLAVVGWLQVAWSVHEQISAVAQGDNEDEGGALVGFFLNMALVLMHYSGDALRERVNSAERADDIDTLQSLEIIDTPLPALDNPVRELPATGAEQDVGPMRTAVDYGWVTPLGRLTPSQLADLKTFNVATPTAAIRETRGFRTGLLQSGDQWYAEVDGHCFNVNVEQDDVRVVAANGRRGPWLKADGKGRWVLDLRLRLAGGAPGREAEVMSPAHELKSRFDTEYAHYTEAQMPDPAIIGRLQAETVLANRIMQIDVEIDHVVVLRQRAKLLLDLLEQRRRVEVVQDYAALRQRFLETQVHCLRFQVRLLEVLRTTRYKQIIDPASISELSLHEVSKFALSSITKVTLRLIASMHGEAVQLCREQRLAWEAMLETLLPKDAQVTALDAPEWRGKVPILTWLETGLRPRVLRCLRARVETPGAQVLSLLQDVNLRCRLRLSSYRQLCTDPDYSAGQRRQLLNETVDELAWLDVRLAQAAAIPSPFIDGSALSEYRDYIQAIREEIVHDTLQHYAEQGALPVVNGAGWKEIVHSRYFGGLIATQPGSSGESASGSPVEESVEFVDPSTLSVYARFVKTQAGAEVDWAYQAAPSVQVVLWQPQGYINSWRLIQHGNDALTRLPSLEQNLQVAPSALRGDLELLAEQMFEDVRRSLESRKDAVHVDPLKQKLENTLTDKANELIKAGREAYQRMVLAREPTTTGIADLLAEGVVEIKEVPDTGRAPGAGSPPLFRSFYIQKVKASGQVPEVLWFAHFHYPADHSGGALGFKFAHLKPGGTPVAGFEERLRAARGDNERILSIFRTTIEPEAAQTLFFSNEEGSAQ